MYFPNSFSNVFLYLVKKMAQIQLNWMMPTNAVYFIHWDNKNNKNSPCGSSGIVCAIVCEIKCKIIHRQFLCWDMIFNTVFVSQYLSVHFFNVSCKSKNTIEIRYFLFRVRFDCLQIKRAKVLFYVKSKFSKCIGIEWKEMSMSFAW